MSEEFQSTPPVITRKQSLGIAFSSIVGALAVFAVTVITSKVLSPQDNAQFLVFWALMFGTFGALLGIQQEVTRASGSSQLSSAKAGRGARLLPLAALWGSAVALLLVTTSPLWGQRILGENYLMPVLVVAGGAILYACHVTVVGAAAGTGQWTIFAWLGSWEALIRLALVALVALTFGSLWGFQYAVLAPVILWLLLFTVSSNGRRLGSVRGDTSASRSMRTLGWSILTSAAYAVMVTGFPVILKVSVGQTRGAEEALLLAALILGISITRAPIMIPLQMFQGVAISAFLRQQHRPLAALAKPLIALAGIGVLGAVAAYLVGPFLFNLLYANYAGVLSPFTLSALTLASAVMAMVVLTGTASLASGKHVLYLTGWALTVLVALACLYLPLDLALRSIIGLIAGPSAGVIIHLGGLALRSKDTTSDV